MSRRALSPAARGVLLAVSAALRGRVAEIHDGADGTTTATVTEPDGTVLLRCVVRAVSGRRDPRQVLLPLAPGAPQPDPVRVRVWIAEEQWDSQGDDGREILQCPADEPVAWDGRVGWVTALVLPGPTLGQLRSLQRELGYTLHEGDEPPVLTWSAERDGDGWRAVRVPERREALAPSKAVRTAKAKPARLTPEPEADALSLHGETTIAWQPEEGGAWDRAWTELGHGGFRKADAWAKACEGHRAREYNRGGKCVRDSRDEAAP